LETDVLVIGAGIVGLASAYHVKRVDPSAKIVVVDALSGPGYADTGRSAAAFRTFFYSRTNIALAASSIRFYRHVQEELGFDLGMMFVGYLFLLTHSDYVKLKPVLDEMAKRGLGFKLYGSEELERALGVRTSLAGDEEAKLMELEDIEVGVFVEEAGIMRPEKLVEFYYSRLRSMGVKFLFNSEVAGLILRPRKPIGIPYEPLPWQEVRVVGARLRDGSELVARRKVIVAAGARTYQLLDPIGVDVHSKPKKRQVFKLKAEKPELKKLLYARGFNRYNVAPFMILPKGVYVRPAPDENAFWVGLSDNIGRAYEWEPDPQPEEKFYMYGIYPVLSKYFPQFKDVRPYAAWAGFYDISIDSQPVIFEVAGMIVAAGTSGSGIMKADAIGRVVAALYMGEDYATLYGGERIRVSDLGLRERRVEEEKLVL
jgi:glycine/D-amino acid oxidase-like deaminating enzyme